MTTIELNIPDEIARVISSFSQPEEEFVLEAIEEKIERERGKVNLASAASANGKRRCRETLLLLSAKIGKVLEWMRMTNYKLGRL